MNKSVLLKYAAQLKSGKDATDLVDRKIVAKVVGVTFEGRQEQLCKITDDTPIMLERDRRNEYDFYAVKVVALIEDAWFHVGYIPKTMSKKLSHSLDQGVELKCSVNKLKGGESLGMKYHIPSGEMREDILHYGLDITIEGKIQN